MDVNQVCQVLEATISPDTAQIQLAQHQLEQAAAGNLARAIKHTHTIIAIYWQPLLNIRHFSTMFI